MNSDSELRLKLRNREELLYKFLREVFLQTNGNVKIILKVETVCNALGFDTSQAIEACAVLEGEGYLRILDDRTSHISITNDGLKELKAKFNLEADAESEKSMQVNIFGDLNHSSVQIAGDDAVQIAEINEMDFDRILEVLEKFETLIKELDIPDNESCGITANLGTVKSQLKSDKPDRNIIHGAWTTLHGIFQGVIAGSIVSPNSEIMELWSLLKTLF